MALKSFAIVLACIVEKGIMLPFLSPFGEIQSMILHRKITLWQPIKLKMNIMNQYDQLPPDTCLCIPVNN